MTLQYVLPRSYLLLDYICIYLRLNLGVKSEIGNEMSIPFSGSQNVNSSINEITKARASIPNTPPCMILRWNPYSQCAYIAKTAQKHSQPYDQLFLKLFHDHQHALKSMEASNIARIVTTARARVPQTILENLTKLANATCKENTRKRNNRNQ